MHLSFCTIKNHELTISIIVDSENCNCTECLQFSLIDISFILSVQMAHSFEGHFKIYNFNELAYIGLLFPLPRVLRYISVFFYPLSIGRMFKKNFITEFLIVFFLTSRILTYTASIRSTCAWKGMEMLTVFSFSTATLKVLIITGQKSGEI